MESRLNKWFEAAKQANPLVSIQEVGAMITAPPKRWRVKPTFKTYIIMAISLSTLGGITWLLSFQPVSEKNYTDVTRIAETVVVANEDNNKELPFIADGKAVVLPEHKNKAEDTGEIQDRPFQALAPVPLPFYESQTGASIDVYDRILYADKQTLEKLDIVIEAGRINYYYKTYKHQEQVKATQLVSHSDKFYFIKGKPGKNYFIKPWEMSFYPLYLTDSSGEHQQSFHFQDKPEGMDDKTYRESLRNQFLSSYKRLVPVGIRSPFNNELSILWYKPTKYFLNRLPEQYAELYAGDLSKYVTRSQYRYMGDTADGKIIYLTYDELAGLGIKTDGNVLRYENKTDTVARLSTGVEGEPLEYAYFSIDIEEHGSVRSSRGSKPADALLVKTSGAFWPLFVERMTNDTHLLAIESLAGGADELVYFRSVREHLIPVAVSLTAKPGRYSYDNLVVFWFKPDPSFYHALPLSAAERNKDRFTAARLNSVETIRTQYNYTTFTAANHRIVDSVTLDNIKQRALKLTKSELKKLNISLLKNGYKYDNRFYKNGKVNVLKIKAVEYYTETQLNDKLLYTPSTRRGDKDFYPLALSGENMYSISFFYFIDNEVSPHEKLHKSRELFKSQVNQLVPVQVEYPLKEGGTGKTMFWFEPTDRFLNALPQRVRQELTEIQKK